MRASGSRTNESVLSNTFTQAQIVVPKEQQVGALAKMTGAPGFLNNYYDDEGWWALAWIDAYDLTAQPQYLAMARSIFTDMSGAWDDTCGGGIWWSKDRTYKNAIANELFFAVSASLARRGTDAQRAQATDWAAKEWAWFQSSGMINNDHLVNDGLTIDKADNTCRNNGRTVWTYNQGVVLGALTEWSRTNHDSNLLMQARILADAGLAHLTDDNGILHDPCEPACGADANQFKGIFVRNLRQLNQQVQEPRYRGFFARNASSIWEMDRTATNAIRSRVVRTSRPGQRGNPQLRTGCDRSRGRRAVAFRDFEDDSPRDGLETRGVTHGKSRGLQAPESSGAKQGASAPTGASSHPAGAEAPLLTSSVQRAKARCFLQQDPACEKACGQTAPATLTSPLPSTTAADTPRRAPCDR